MMELMKRRLIAWIFVVGSLMGVPNFAHAADAPPVYDVRLEGLYTTGPNPITPGALTLPSGTALLWLIMIALIGASAGVMFINAKRTHLD